MSGIDVKETATYSVGSRAEDLDIFLGVIWNSATILLVVCVSVKSNTNNPRFEIGWELGDRVENNGSSLAETSRYNSSVLALLRSILDVLGGLSDSRSCGACWSDVVYETCRVCWAADALACDIVAENFLQS